MASKTGKNLHGKAEILREKDQDFLGALEKTDEAIVAYQKDGDLRGLSEVMMSRRLTLTHLHEKTGERSFLVLAKHAALAGVEIAEGLGDPQALAIVYLEAGKTLGTLEDWSGAKEYLEKALDAQKKSPPPEHDRPAVVSYVKTKLAYATYVSGDKAGLSLMEEGIEELTKNNSEPKYNRDAWLSGAHMDTARMLAKDDPEKSKEHLQIAEKIIEANKELVLRKEQLEKLKRS